jgi:hypothetical protein
MTAQPTIARVEVVPVAGHDSMLMNLSGAHGPFFTRNVVIVTDSDGRTGLGEVPGGEKIRTTIEEAGALIAGKPVARYRSLLREVAAEFADRDAGGRACRPSTCAPRSTLSPPSSPRCWTCTASSLASRWPNCWATASSALRAHARLPVLRR